MWAFFVVFNLILTDGIVFTCFAFGGGVGFIIFAEDCLVKYDSRLAVEVEAFDPVGMDSLTKWGSEKLYRVHFRIKTDKGSFTFSVLG